MKKFQFLSKFSNFHQNFQMSVIGSNGRNGNKTLFKWWLISFNIFNFFISIWRLWTFVFTCTSQSLLLGTWNLPNKGKNINFDETLLFSTRNSPFPIKNVSFWSKMVNFWFERVSFRSKMVLIWSQNCQFSVQNVFFQFKNMELSWWGF